MKMPHTHRPDPGHAGSMARWLVASNSWGVVSTVSVHLNGIPFGNVVSYSDGPDGNSTGVPYFYMSTLDPTPKDLAIIPYASLTVSESPLGTCGDKDVENPTCAKITLSGQISELNADTDESEFAAFALFSKHPEMKGWPKDHNFKFYALKIQDIFLIDWYGGAKALSVDEYLNTTEHSSL
ncbi:hypothetical protein GOP47_0007276 [Adiantum capillus-veneris]|uniref:CREG-like beta-barrel domain-containing protein n=1 Tax=Adiantum capillus-veneris TaxID=13818 RepID=A0A9D4ZKR9_ADICA|nr:hypothetical protein GOP47_0007276 [Adiantum capillus-veneris]